MTQAFTEGFLSKCAEAGLEKEAAIGLLRGLAAKAFPSIGRNITRNAARIAAGHGGPKAISQIMKRRGTAVANALGQQRKNFGAFNDRLHGLRNTILHEGYFGPGPGEPWSSYGEDVVRKASRNRYDTFVPPNRKPKWLSDAEAKGFRFGRPNSRGQFVIEHINAAPKHSYLTALDDYIRQPKTIGDVSFGVHDLWRDDPLRKLPLQMENVARTAYDRVGGLNRLLERNTRPVDLQELVAQLSRG